MCFRRTEALFFWMALGIAPRWVQSASMFNLVLDDRSTRCWRSAISFNLAYKDPLTTDDLRFVSILDTMIVMMVGRMIGNFSGLSWTDEMFLNLEIVASVRAHKVRNLFPHSRWESPASKQLSQPAWRLVFCAPSRESVDTSDKILFDPWVSPGSRDALSLISELSFRTVREKLPHSSVNFLSARFSVFTLHQQRPFLVHEHHHTQAGIICCAWASILSHMAMGKGPSWLGQASSSRVGGGLSLCRLSI